MAGAQVKPYCWPGLVSCLARSRKVAQDIGSVRIGGDQVIERTVGATSGVRRDQGAVERGHQARGAADQLEVELGRVAARGRQGRDGPDLQLLLDVLAE